MSDSGFARLPLYNRGRHFGDAFVDAGILHLLLQYSWHYCKYNNSDYAFAYVVGPDGRRRRTSLHRFVWDLLHGPIPEGKVVDHGNRDGLDCRGENLRLAEQRQNLLNVYRPNRDTGAMNVYKARGGLFCVKFCTTSPDGKTRYKRLGPLFKTVEEAERFRDAYLWATTDRADLPFICWHFDPYTGERVIYGQTIADHYLAPHEPHVKSEEGYGVSRLEDKADGTPRYRADLMDRGERVGFPIFNDPYRAKRERDDEVRRRGLNRKLNYPDICSVGVGLTSRTSISA